MKLASKLGLGLLPLLAVILLTSSVIAMLPPQKARAAPTPVNASGEYGGNTVTVSCIGNLGYGSYSSIANIVNGATGTPPAMVISFLFDIANDVNPPDNSFLYVASQLESNPGGMTGYVYFTPAPGESNEHAADICMRSGLYFSRPDNRRGYVGFEYNYWNNDSPSASARSGRQGNTNNDLDREWFSFGQGYQVPSRNVTRIELADPNGALNDPYFNTVDSGYEDWLAGPDGPTEAEENANEGCESADGLAWIGCPILRGVDSALASIQANVVDILVIEPEKYENDNVKSAWVIFRNIASALLIIVMLVMVISTALGFSFVDAYTVKKMLPKLVAAAILIQLSWPLMSFAINVVNAIGEGLFGLMLAPFGGQEATDLPSLVLNAEGGQGLFNTIVLIGLAGGGIALGFMGLLSLAFVTFLTVLIGFAVLVIRNLVVIAALIFAPIAIVAWVMPGTSKLWSLWWDSFSKALLMFPFIMILFAGGRILAWVTINTNASGDAVDLGWDWMQLDHSGSIFQLIIIVLAYAIPFFIIPFTLRFAGGLVATLGGFANDRSRGIFDRQQKFREARRADNISRAGNNNRWDRNSRLGKMFNTPASIVASPLANAAVYGRNIPGLGKKGYSILSGIEAQSAQETGKLFEELNEKYKFNDKAYRALSGAHSKFKGKNVNTGVSTRDALDKAGLLDKAPTTLRQFQQMAEILSQSDEATEQVAGNVLSGAAGRLATLYQDPEMGKANVQAAGILGLAAHGFADGNDLETVGNNMIDQKMSTSLAQSFINGAQVAGQRQRPDIKAGYGTVFRDGKFVDGTGTVRDTAGNVISVGERAESLIKTLSSADLATAKSGAIESLREPIMAMHRAGGNKAQAVEDQLMNWAGPYSQASVAVKAEALKIIEDLSGPKGNHARKEQRVNARNELVEVEVPYFGYAPGTIGEKFEKRTRAETDPATRGEAGGQDESDPH